MNELIKLENIKKSYCQREVLASIDFVVNKAEFVLIHGKSGCGKSTLLNIMGLLDTFDEGTYYYNGNLVRKRSKDDLRADTMGFVFQSPCLLENLSIRDNILMPYLYNEKALDTNRLDMLERLICHFNLEHLTNRKVKFLSGGEKQRVSIARAIIKNPEVIFADEPTGNLDPDNAEIVFNEFKRLSKEGKTIIVVTHNTDVFAEVNRKYIIENGRMFHE